MVGKGGIGVVVQEAHEFAIAIIHNYDSFGVAPKAWQVAGACVWRGSYIESHAQSVLRFG